MQIETHRKRVSAVSVVYLTLLVAAELTLLSLQRRTVKAEEKLQRLSLLAAEMRQSSNELTELVRDYVVTGDPQYREHYFEVLEIRSGKRPRPEDYSVSDWRAVRSAQGGQYRPMLELLRAEGVPEETFALLAESQAESDALADLEIDVMAQLEQRLARGAGDMSARVDLIARLHDARYQASKHAIMLAASKFENAVRGQAFAEVEALQTTQRTVLLATFVIVGLMLVGVLTLLFYAKREVLTPLKSLSAAAERLSEADYTARASVSAPNELGLLARVFNQMASSIASDIAERELAEETLRESEQRWRALCEGSADAIVIADKEGRIERVNARTEALFGYEREELLGKSVDVLVPPSLRARHAEHRAAFEWSPEARPMAGRADLLGLHRDGHVIPVSIGLSVLESFGTWWSIAIVHDLTALRTANETLQQQLAEIESLQAMLLEQAVRDPLTGLYNRRYLSDFLDRELARSRRERRPVAVALLDVDHFKHINDTYGHRAGDKALRAIATLLRSQTRVTDTIFRYGGEEFLLVMPGASLADAMVRVDTLRGSYEDSVVEYDGAPIRTTFSAGVAVYPDHGSDGDTAIHAADEALYGAKSAGRNRVIGYGVAADRTSP